MTYIKQTKACVKCNFPVLYPGVSGVLCGMCYTKKENPNGDAFATDLAIKRIDDLKINIESKYREISILREELSKRPIKTRGCPECGAIGSHECAGNHKLEPSDTYYNGWVRQYKKWN